MSEPQTETTQQSTPTQQDGAITVAQNGNGVTYDVFVTIKGAQFRIATFPTENVDAEVAETQRERQAAQTPPGA